MLLAEAPAAEDVHGAWSLMAILKASETDAISVAKLLPHRPAEVSEFRTLLGVMGVPLTDSANPLRASRHPIEHGSITQTTENSQRYLTLT